MKRTIYLMMLAAALTAGQTFADFIPTLIESESGEYLPQYYEYDGKYSAEADVSGVLVTVSSPETGGQDMSTINVYGAYVDNGYNATNNKILMTGGEVKSLHAGMVFSGDSADVSGNKVIMLGGKVTSIAAGENYTAGGTLTGNHAVITGGEIGKIGMESNLWGGYSDTGVTANNNTVSLVGNGGSITIDGQKYEGHAITINANIAVGTADGTGNALDIYGKDITLGGGISGTQVMNFHLVDGLSDNTAMLMHMGVANLNLTNITTFGFDGSAVTNWAAYDGKSIMLLESYNGQILGVGDSTDVEIMGADGSAVATATLGLANGGKALSLTNIQSKGTPTPEPTTGVLSLLALAALAGRKRRK